jgi:hypothetical protein
MARLINIDNNPLRRSASALTEAAQMKHTSDQIGVTADKLSISLEQNAKSKELFKAQQEYEEAKEKEDGIGQMIIGGLKVAGGIALAAAGGPAGIVSGASLAASGASEFATGFGDTTGWYDISGANDVVQQGISVSEGVAQQIYSHQRTVAQKNLSDETNDAISSMQARNNGFWFMNKQNKLEFAMDTQGQQDIAALNKKYAWLGEGSGTNAFNQWQNQNQMAGAQQFAQRLQQQQSQVINQSLESFYQNPSSGAANVFNTIKSLNMNPDQEAAAVSSAASMMKYHATQSGVDDMRKAGASEADIDAYIDGGGDKKVDAALKAYHGRGEYSDPERNLAAREARIAEKVDRLPDSMDYAEKRKEAERSIDSEDVESKSLELSAKEKEALKAKAAEDNVKYAEAKGQEAAKLFDDFRKMKGPDGKTMGVAGALIAARQKALEVTTKDEKGIEQTGTSKNDLVIAQVEKALTQKRMKAVGEDFSEAFNKASTIKEFEGIAKRLTPPDEKGKGGGDASADYDGIRHIQAEHYRKAMNEVDSRKAQALAKAERDARKAAVSVNAKMVEEVELKQDVLDSTFRAFQEGRVTGDVVLHALNSSPGVFDEEKERKIISAVLFGKDGNKKTETIFNNAMDAFRKLGVSEQTKLEMMDLMYQTRMDNTGMPDIHKKLNAVIEGFTDKAVAEFLPGALASAAGGNISTDQAKEAIKLGAQGKFDSRYFSRTDVSGKSYDVVVGDDEQMENLMSGVKTASKTEVVSLLNLPADAADDIKFFMAEKEGDKKGHLAFHFGGDTLRLNVDKKNQYVLEKETPAGWTQFTPEKFSASFTGTDATANRAAATRAAATRAALEKWQEEQKKKLNETPNQAQTRVLSYSRKS